MKALLLFTGRNAEHHAGSDNATQMAYSLLELGLDVDIQASNLADPVKFAEDFANGIGESDIIIIVGGMGDDYIKNARDIVCGGLGLSMIVYQPSLPKMEKLCKNQNREMEEKDLAYISTPVDGKVFDHRESVIPGFAVVSGEQAVIMLPDNGEVYADMFVKQVIPYLIEWLQLDMRHDVIYPFGITERQAKFLLTRLSENRRPLISLFCRQGTASAIQILEHHDGNSDIVEDMEDADFLVKGFLGGLYTTYPINEMPKRVVEILKANEFTVAVGESLTEGLLARNIMAVKKHQDILKGHAHSLLNVVKQEEMGVPKEITTNYLDASEEMAVSMAYGVMEKFGADIGVSICGGMAADGRGGFDSTAYITLITPQGVKSDRIDLLGISASRDQAVGIYTIVALNAIYEFLNGLPGSVRELVGLASGEAEDIENTAQIIRYRAESKKQLLEERYAENQKIQDTAKEYLDPKPTPMVEIISEISPGERVESSFEPNRMEMTLGFRGIANPEEYLKAERLATATITNFKIETMPEESGVRRKIDEAPPDVSEMPIPTEESGQNQTFREAFMVDRQVEPPTFPVEKEQPQKESIPKSTEENKTEGELIGTLDDTPQEVPLQEDADSPIAEVTQISIDESGEATERASQKEEIPNPLEPKNEKEDDSMNSGKVQNINELIPAPEKKKGSALKIVFIILLVLTIGVGAVFGIRAYLDSKPKNMTEVMAQYKEVSAGALKVRMPSDLPEEYPARFVPLYNVNKEVEAVVEISGTDLSLPVVKTGDNITYTQTDFFQNASDDGTPFLDYRSAVDPTLGNPLIYGKSGGSGDEFGVITQYQDIRFAQDHPTLRFDTVMGGGDYAIFSTFIAGTDNSRADVYDFSRYIKAVDMDTFTEMVEDTMSRSITEFPVDVSYGDEVVMLVTNSEEFSGARFVVIARKFREGEKQEVNSGLMKLSVNPIYPEQWYEANGLEKPDNSRESVTIDLSLNQQAPEPVEEPEVPASSAPSSSVPQATSSTPPSSVPLSSQAPSSAIPSSTPASSNAKPGTSASAPTASVPSAAGAASSKQDGDGWIEVSAEQEGGKKISSSAPDVSSGTAGGGGTGTTGNGSVGGGGTLSVKVNGGVYTGDAQEVLSKIVANEMGTNFPDEALKAQAVASYSYILYENSRGNSPTVYFSTPNSKVSNAVSTVMGQKVTYGGNVAYTTYYAMSAGQTNSSKDVWGGSIPYLTTVSSPWDTSVASYKVNKTFSEEEVRNKIETQMGITVTGDPSTWFEVVNKTGSGYNEDMLVCGNSKTSSGKKITGRYLREGVFSLRSAAFDVSYSNGTFTFTTYGYGHGVGMSQWGANGMAKEGYTYDQIIAYYYPGTSLS